MRRTTAEVLETFREMGEERCANARDMDASLILPIAPAWAKDREAFYLKQVRSMGVVDLNKHYVELLVRTHALLEFFSHNVGPDDEWPVSLVGESEEAETMADSMLRDVAVAVGCLVEI